MEDTVPAEALMVIGRVVDVVEGADEF